MENSLTILVSTVDASTAFQQLVHKVKVNEGLLLGFGLSQLGKILYEVAVLGDHHLTMGLAVEGSDGAGVVLLVTELVVKTLTPGATSVNPTAICKPQRTLHSSTLVLITVPYQHHAKFQRILKNPFEESLLFLVKGLLFLGPFYFATVCSR